LFFTGLIAYAGLAGLPPAAALTIPYCGELGDVDCHVPMHSTGVGAARQLAGGSMCWGSCSDARQHVGATPGVQAA